MNKYTNIGEVVVTSTVLGRAKVQTVQNMKKRRVIFSLLAVVALGIMMAAWLVRGKQKSAGNEPVVAAVVADMGTDQRTVSPHTAQQERGAPQPEQNSTLAESAPFMSSQQKANNELRNAQQLEAQGKTSEAVERYRSALMLDASNNKTRQAMIDMLLKNHRKADAERALQLGLKNSPNSSSYSLQLARLLAERNEQVAALDVMQRALPYAVNQADYQAFYASLLQGQGRHNDAVTYYQKALGLKPGNGEWLMNMGISLRAAGRTDEAQNAFKHALEAHTLDPQARAFVEKQISPAVRVPEATPVTTPATTPVATPPATPQAAPQ